MKEKSFLKNYFSNQKFDLFDEEELEKLQETKKVLIETNKNKKKLSYLATVEVQLLQVTLAWTLTKNAKIRCVIIMSLIYLPVSLMILDTRNG